MKSSYNFSKNKFRQMPLNVKRFSSFKKNCLALKMSEIAAQAENAKFCSDYVTILTQGNNKLVRKDNLKEVYNTRCLFFT